MSEEVANPSGAAEQPVTDVESAAAVLEARYTAQDKAEDKTDATEEVEEVEAEPVDTEDAETEEESDDSPETDDDGSDEREAEEESEDPQFHSVDELAEALDLSPEDFKDQVTAKVKVNGEEKEVNLAELTKGYQLESDYRQKTMDLAENRKAFESESQQAREHLTARITEATNLVANLEQSILGEYNNVDWNNLRATDPAEYAALQSDYQNRYKAVQQMKGQALNAANQVQSENTAMTEQQRNEVLQKETEALLEVLPEWRDKDVAKTQKAQMREFLKSYKFTDQEIAQLADHRIVLMVMDAQKGRQSVSKADVAKKKVVKAPKLQKPGNKPSKQTIQAQKLKDLKSRVRKTGHTDDVAALLLARS
mgnify:CR=1 FL=1